MKKQTRLSILNCILTGTIFLLAQFNLALAQCPQMIDNYTYMGMYNNSVYFLSNVPAQPLVAERNAEELNGHLVDINSQAENDFVQSIIDEMTYIGLNDFGTTNENELSWTSGAQVSYTNFDFCVFCNENDDVNDFVMIHPWNGGWSFMNQWSTRKYIVEISCSDGGNGGGGSTNECENNVDGFAFLGSHNNSNYFLSNEAYNFATAFGIANANGAHLVNIDNAAENNFLQENIDEMVLIGLNDRDTEGQLFWVGDNSDSGYRNFETNCGFCNSNDDENDYALIHPWNGKWSFTNQWSQRKFIMEVHCEDSGSNQSLTYTNCSSDITIQLAQGQTAAVVDWMRPTLVNNCDAGISADNQISGPNNGSSLSAGNYTVRYRGTNNCGQTANCIIDIQILSAPPGPSSSLSFQNCPSDRTVVLDPGASTAYVSWTPPSVRSTCSAGGLSLGLINGPSNGSNLSEGEYVISYRGSNNCGDMVMCEFTISVISIGTSTITVDCPEDQTFQANNPPLQPIALLFFDQPTYNNTCLEEGANGSDGVVTNSALFSFQQGTNLSPGSFTTADFVAYNLCGDTATCNWTITTLPPSIPTSIEFDCPNDLNLVIPVGSSTTALAFNLPSANNICYPSNSIQIVQTGGPTRNSQVGPGTYAIQYRATNMCGDEEFCSFNVNVTQNGDGGGNPGGNVTYTANDQVTPYTGLFRPGSNVGYNPPWTDEEMADLVAGNPALGIKGIGAKSMRPGLYDIITAVYGYDFRLETYEHYASLGLEDLTMIVGFPIEWHRDQTDYCGNGFNSSMFRNLYTDIWDDGTDGTPYNDDNFYAAYLYEVVSRYGPYVKFWEIWNEPGFDLTGNRGWRQPGDAAGNWWDSDPDPCEYILRAPIEHYVRTLRISWEIIKTLQPDDYVTVAGVGYTSFLDAILRNTDDPNTGGAITPDHPLRGGAYFDMMGFHSYPDIDGSVYDFNFTTGERVWHRNSDAAAQGIKRTMDNYTDILDNYGYGVSLPMKEWIITEINVPRKPFRPDAMSGGEEMQVNYIIKATAIAMQNDVTQMHVYNLGDRTTEAEAVTEFDLYGLHKRLTGTDAYTHVRNLEAIAYKSAADFVWGSTYDAVRTSQMNLPSNADGVALRMNNGRHKYIIWAKTMIDQSEFASASYSFPASFGYGEVYRRLWDFTETDQVVGISSNNIALSGRPIFITETPNNSELEARLGEENLSQLAINNILPNPAVDEIKLVLEARESDNYDIQIYNATGQLIEQRNTFIQRGFSEERFDISEYVHGMYFVIIKGSQMRWSQEVKFIKAEKP